MLVILLMIYITGSVLSSWLFIKFIIKCHHQITLADTLAVAFIGFTSWVGLIVGVLMSGDNIILYKEDN